MPIWDVPLPSQHAHEHLTSTGILFVPSRSCLLQEWPANTAGAKLTVPRLAYEAIISL